MCLLSTESEGNETLCASYDEDNCRFVYVYSYNDTKGTVVRAQNYRECPERIGKSNFTWCVLFFI